MPGAGSRRGKYRLQSGGETRCRLLSEHKRSCSSFARDKGGEVVSRLFRGGEVQCELLLPSSAQPADHLWW